MYFYLFKMNDEVVGGLQSDSVSDSTSLTPVSEEEYAKYFNVNPEVSSETVETPVLLPEVPIETKLEAITERQEFLEDCIAEMAAKVYSDV